MKSKISFSYSQPDEYHFSEDSIFLVNQVISDSSEDEFNSVVDIGAGCGIVGLEFINKFEGTVKNLTLLEPQSVYISHLNKNIQNHLSDTKVKIRNEKIQDIKLNVDLILCNPPYYDSGKGRIPENLVVKKSKFSEELSPRDLIKGVEKILSPGGRAYILLGKNKEQTHLESEYESKSLEKKIISSEPYLVLRFIKLHEQGS
ncbi:MAG: methyltransferase [Bacteriovoracaceae bacterium]|nr:methyltransferase [Bacteriovoracaceae bacterium]